MVNDINKSDIVCQHTCRKTLQQFHIFIGYISAFALGKNILLQLNQSVRTSITVICSATRTVYAQPFNVILRIQKLGKSFDFIPVLVITVLN